MHPETPSSPPRAPGRPQAPRPLLLNPSATVGGAERVLLDLVAELGRQRPGWRPVVLAGADGPLLDEARRLGAEAVALPMPGAVARLGDWAARGGGRARLAARLALASPAVALYALRLRRALARLAPDLVHTNGFKMHALGAVCAPAGVPVVWHLHDYPGRRPAMARLLARLGGRAAAAIANSESVAADARAVLGTGGRRPAPPVTAVLNGVDLDRFRPPEPAAGPGGGTADLDALAGLPPAPPGTVRVGLVATLARWKGHEVFLRALARLAAGPAGGGEPPPVRGYVIGGALYATGGSQTSADELEALAGRLGLGDRVGFTGFVPDAAAALRALDVAVHASTEPEPFGLAIAEAMASGRAVVVAAAGGAAELIRDGVDALAHPPGDDAALAARIAALAADPELRRRLGAAARATAERRFDRRRAAAGVIEVWERALATASLQETSG